MSSPHHTAYLKAMGIQAWQLRQHRLVDVEPDAAPVLAVTEPPTASTVPHRAELNESSIPAHLNDASGIEVAEQDPVAAVRSRNAVDDGENPVRVNVPGRDVSAYSWSELRSSVASCTACVLHETRTQTVFGVGNERADWLIIGEAPGAEEDRQGEPFVGRAGQLLNNMLKAAGLAREQVFIANILKCRPPNNRDPRPEETAQCEAFLRRQIALVKPRVILVVGRIAAHNLLKTSEPLSRLRGKPHHYANPDPDAGDIPLVVTYHPAYLLRKPSDKARAWDDLRLARRLGMQGVDE